MDLCSPELWARECSHALPFLGWKLCFWEDAFLSSLLSHCTLSAGEEGSQLLSSMCCYNLVDLEITLYVQSTKKEQKQWIESFFSGRCGWCSQATQYKQNPRLRHPCSLSLWVRRIQLLSTILQVRHRDLAQGARYVGTTHRPSVGIRDWDTQGCSTAGVTMELLQ